MIKSQALNHNLRYNTKYISLSPRNQGTKIISPSYKTTKTEIIRRLFQRRSEPTNTYRTRRLVIHSSQSNRNEPKKKQSDLCISPRACVNTKIEKGRKLNRSPLHKHPNCGTAISAPWEECVKSQKFIEIYQSLVLSKGINITPVHAANSNPKFKQLAINNENNELRPNYKCTIRTSTGCMPKLNEQEDADNYNNVEIMHSNRNKEKNKNNVAPLSIMDSHSPYKNNAKINAIYKRKAAKPNDYEYPIPTTDNKQDTDEPNMDIPHMMTLNELPRDCAPPLLMRSQTSKSTQLNTLINSRKQKFFDQAELTPWD